MQQPKCLWECLLVAWLFFPVYAVGENHSAIILRMNTVALNEQSLPSTSATSAETAKEVFWLSVTALLTFGLPLIDLPNVLERGEANARPIRECLESWAVIRNGPNSWLKSADIRDFVLQTLQRDIARLMAEEAHPVRVQTEPNINAPQDAPAIKGGTTGLTAHAALLAEVSLVIESSTSAECGAQIRLNANLHTDTDLVALSHSNPSELTNLVTVSGAKAVDVHAWAQDPEAGRIALQIAIRQLASAIVRVYASTGLSNSSTSPERR